MDYHARFDQAIQITHMEELQRQEREQAQIADMQRQLAALLRQKAELERATQAAREEAAAHKARGDRLQAEKEARLKAAADNMKSAMKVVVSSPILLVAPVQIVYIPSGKELEVKDQEKAEIVAQEDDAGRQDTGAGRHSLDTGRDSVSAG